MKKSALLFLSIAFFTSSNQAQSVTDYDGNVYETVAIGAQVWMRENLKVTHYRNGDSITEVRDSLDWVNQTTGAWCYFNNDPSIGAVYGNLYNWYAGTDPRGLAPEGWHVPTDAEWKSLEMYLGMSQSDADKIDWRGTDEGAQLKETDTIHWIWPTGNAATNSSGFTAYGGGWRIYFQYPGSFYNLTNTGEWWSSTESDAAGAWLRNLCVYHENIYRINFGKTQGCSVRCIRDFPSGVNEVKDDMDIKIYPNPATNKIDIEYAGAQNLTLQILDVVGKCIIQKNLTNNTAAIDIGSLQKGIYVLKFTSASETLEKKLIKE